jgi:predicted AlkP superfamily phosphohydrolase/phosphomutase
MSRSAPCVLIGWDGATFDLLKPWVEQGLLPNLAKMMARGSSRVLRSVFPPVSPAAWVSIISGLNPGKHGILYFKEFDANDYVPLKSVLINSTHFAGNTILDLLSDRGARVCSLQIPLTYPVWKINGLMLAGIPNPDDSQSYTYPPERAAEFGQLFPFPSRRKMPHSDIMELKTFHITKLTDIFCKVSQEDYDLILVYFRESDDFHHLYWRLLNENCPGFDAAESAEIGNPILTIYQKLDAELGRLLDAIPSANFFLISDHGGTAMGRKRLYLNTWLMQQGYLKPQRTLRGTLERALFRCVQAVKYIVPQGLLNLQESNPGLVRAWVQVRNSTHSINWDKSRAFGVVMYFPVAGVHLNVRDRQEHGCVEPGEEFERLRDELIEKLKALKDPETGRPIVLEIHRREDIYTGAYTSQSPDIVMLLDSDLTVRAELSSRVWGETSLRELKDFCGDHDMNGIFVAAGPDVQAGGFLPEANLLDVAPTMLASMEQAVPQNMDGKVLKDVFLPEFLAAHPPTYDGERPLVVNSGENIYSAEEAEAIRERLESLGYIEE